MWIYFLICIVAYSYNVFCLKDIDMCETGSTNFTMRTSETFRLKFNPPNGILCNCFIITNDNYYLGISPKLKLESRLGCMDCGKKCKACDELSYYTCHEHGKCFEHEYQPDKKVNTESKFNDTAFEETQVLYHRVLLKRLKKVNGVLFFKASRQSSIRVECDIGDDGNNVRSRPTDMPFIVYSTSSTVPRRVLTTSTTTIPTITYASTTTSLSGTTQISTSSRPTKIATATSINNPTLSSPINSSSRGITNDGETGARVKEQNDDGGESNTQAVIIGVAVTLIMIIGVILFVVLIIVMIKRRKKVPGGSFNQRNQTNSSHVMEPVRYATNADMEAHNVHMTLSDVGPRRASQLDTYSAINESTNNPSSYADVLRENSRNQDEATYANIDNSESNRRAKDTIRRNDDYFEDCSAFRRPVIVANTPENSRDSKNVETHDNEAYELSNSGGSNTGHEPAMNQGSGTHDAVNTDEVQFEDNDFYSTGQPTYGQIWDQ